MDALDILCGDFASEFDVSIENAKAICKKYHLADQLLKENKKFLEENSIKIFEFYGIDNVNSNTFNIYGVTVHTTGYEESEDRVFLATLSSIENLEEEMGKLNYYFIYGNVEDFWKGYCGM